MQSFQPVWFGEQDFDLDAFERECRRVTAVQDCPFAEGIVEDIPIYSGDALRNEFQSEARSFEVMQEFNRVFTTGAGIFAVRGGYDDIPLIDDVTSVLFSIIDEEEAGDNTSGDHFAEAGTNSRLWNSHQKLADRNPDLFIRYNANEIVHRACQAWLGTGYQITTQVNVVRPGGRAQMVHRDYHMGIQTEAALKCSPAGQHATVPLLTLQGAVAHTETPIASGPTKLLPFSQHFQPGYLAVRRPEFQAFFQENCVQLALNKGDLLFFNPAIFHAAGDNTTKDIQRFVNLMQVGSIYGRTMEHVDRSAMVKKVYPQLLEYVTRETMPKREIENVIAATAEAYPFPANLDNDAPLGPSGMTPASQQELLREALAGGWLDSKLNAAIDAQDRLRFGG
ncbi:phytanoyl-CoA dioxygenase family protein [Shimia sp.]|uniref:phytanoyl-CoA dioxygenase family protein n=1 Tax=Shimia sp. TaxID=1954381 RepID=UPI00329A64F7